MPGDWKIQVSLGDAANTTPLAVAIQPNLAPDPAWSFDGLSGNSVILFLLAAILGLVFVFGRLLVRHIPRSD
jgi:hypothetical protein